MQYSIVSLGQVKFDNELFRFDAEFFRRELLDLEGKIKNNQWEYLEEVCDSIINFGAYSLCNQIEFINNGVPYLNVGDIGEGIIFHDKSPKIDNRLSELVLWKSLVKEGQVLLTIAGTIGNAAIATNLPEYCNSNQAIANINVSKRISPYYLTIFLNCKYGKGQTKRLTISSVQPNLLLTQVKKIKTYMPNFQFQEIISEHYKAALNVLAKSENLHNQAQILLLTELGLTDWQPRHQLTFVKNYSDTKQSNRIDAEYYQPKYEEIIKVIKAYKSGWSTLGNLVNVEKCVEVGSDEYLDEGIPFIRVSNLSPLEITKEKYISEKLYTGIEQHQPRKGEILLSKDATPGIAYYLNEQPQKMIPSGGILRLENKTNKVNNEYLTLVLNSILTKEQVNRDVGGSVILHWRPDQVKETVIPVLPEDKQTQIQQKVIESFDLRKQSRHLLECAKRAVEIAIEDDEQTAIKWLETETEEIQI